MASMLQRTRETLTLVLLVLLPFHALFVTVGTRVLEGPGNAPLAMLALWKETLLALALLIAFIEWLKSSDRWRFDLLDGLLIAFAALALAVSLLLHTELRMLALGIKYDLVPLGVFFLLRRVPWSEKFLPRALAALFVVGGVVAGYGVLTLFLPQGFFSFLGYSDLHSLYLPDGSLAAFQRIEGLPLKRIQSTLSGPNQLGLWLLIPWAAGVTGLLTTFCSSPLNGGILRRRKRCWMQGCLLVLLALALLFSFSRSAWIAAGVITIVALYDLLPREAFRRALTRIAGLAVVAALLLAFLAPSLITRATSTRGHLTRPLAAFKVMAQHPLGLGLGSAGPASNRVSDACVFLEEGADALWAADRPNLCVFVGSQQVQPTDRACSCPLLPENWYLQVGVELGVAGFLLFLAIVFLLLRCLRSYEDGGELFLMFLGLAVAALFLHAWEESAVAYSVWLLAAVCCPPQKNA